jgi:hypothetical protein
MNRILLGSALVLLSGSVACAQIAQPFNVKSDVNVGCGDTATTITQFAAPAGHRIASATCNWESLNGTNGSTQSISQQTETTVFCTGSITGRPYDSFDVPIYGKVKLECPQGGDGELWIRGYTVPDR